MRTPIVPEGLLSPQQVGGLFDVTPKTVRRWADEGRLEYRVTPGGQYRYTAASVHRLLEESRPGGAASGGGEPGDPAVSGGSPHPHAGAPAGAEGAGAPTRPERRGTVTDTPASGADTPETMIRALAAHLDELGIPYRLDDENPRLTLADGIVVQCAPRTFMGGRLWFYLDGDRDSRAIAPADKHHIEVAGQVIAAELRMAAAPA